MKVMKKLLSIFVIGTCMATGGYFESNGTKIPIDTVEAVLREIITEAKEAEKYSRQTQQNFATRLQSQEDIYTERALKNTERALKIIPQIRSLQGQIAELKQQNKKESTSLVLLEMSLKDAENDSRELSRKFYEKKKEAIMSKLNPPDDTTTEKINAEIDTLKNAYEASLEDIRQLKEETEASRKSSIELQIKIGNAKAREDGLRQELSDIL